MPERDEPRQPMTTEPKERHVQNTQPEAAAKTQPRDEFFWISTINKATVVVNRAEGLLDDATARLAARGIRAVEEAAAVDPTKRVKKYIAYEPLLIAATSPEVTLIHAGRSSQDILSTMRMALDWEEAAQIAGALDDVIAKILGLAEQHRDTIVPNYTNGVAAQPNSYAHYLLGFAASFLRDRERLAQCLVRYDMSSMGATVLNGTGWPLNRAAMAAKLGFAREVRNAFDATCQAPVDAVLEIASVAGSIAIHVGSMVNDIMVQYAQPRPWIILQVRHAAKEESRPHEQLPRGRVGRFGGNERRAHARPQRRPRHDRREERREEHPHGPRGGRDAEALPEGSQRPSHQPGTRPGGAQQRLDRLAGDRRPIDAQLRAAL